MIENNFKTFDVVKSISGHDKNMFYIVIKVENKFVFLSDGKIRPLNKLKKKNYKHITLVNLKTEKVKNILKNLQVCAKLENSKIIETLNLIKGELNV